MKLHVTTKGEGAPVVLLHGFPDLGDGWRRQIDGLAAGGFRAVAPDLRGYGRSPRPAGVESYSLDHLVDDVSELIAQYGGRVRGLVGHDWGGVIAWYVAMTRPDLFDRLVILNAPHPRLYARALRRPSRQMLRAWYAMIFQLPWLPERLLSARDSALLDRVWRSGPARDDETRRFYHSMFASVEGVRGPLNYYRAARRHSRPPFAIVESPVLILWGERDRYLGPELLEGVEELAPHVTIDRFADASHWLQHDEPEAVTRKIIGFLR